MKFEVVVVGALETNCYLVYDDDSRECAIVDPGADPEVIFASVFAKEVRPVVILNTHGHVDHTGANRDVKDHYDIPLRIHKADAPMLGKVQSIEIGLLLGAKESPPADSYIAEGEEIVLGKSSLKVLHTPGHSPGSVSLLADRFLLSGDTLFFGGVGRTDLPGGSFKDLESSIKTKILTLEDTLLVLPGHGPATTVREEKDTPFIS